MSSVKQRLAKNLKLYRTMNKLSQEELAEMASLHRTYIGLLENCKRNTTIETLEHLAAALKIDVAELLKNAD